MAKKASKNKNNRHPLLVKVYALFYLIVGLFLAISFSTYSPEDPSFRVSYFSQEAIHFHNKAGKVGAFVSDVLFSLFGQVSWAVVLFLVGNSIYFFGKQEEEKIRGNLVGLFGLMLFLVVASVCVALLLPVEDRMGYGGVLGEVLASGSESLLGPWGSLACFGSLAMVLGVAAFNIPLRRFVPGLVLTPVKFLVVVLKMLYFLVPKYHPSKSKPTQPDFEPIVISKAQLRKNLKEDKEDRAEFIPEPRDSTSSSVERERKRPAQQPKFEGSYELPGLALLSTGGEDQTGFDEEEIQRTAYLLTEKLADFGIEGQVVNAMPGPVITTYEFTPASGIKVSRIANLSDDLSMALSAHSVRIIAPLPGKPSVGIEIPNRKRQEVHLRKLLETKAFQNSTQTIPIVIGKDARGEPKIVDLAKMPHLLVAGATGSGKSVFINSAICGLLYRFVPQQLRMIMIDPKMVELNIYEEIPHLLAPVIVQASHASSALNWAVLEMERRYSKLHDIQVRHLDDYNAKVGAEDYLPYIVVIVDEFADLMITAAKDVEYCIARLAQKARAAGIHLILATQRPSVDVITGTIKANFTARISFKVSSKVDSRTILDAAGADRLLGKGDMLFTLSGASGMERVHGSFVSDRDIHELIDYFHRNYPAQYDSEAIEAIERGVKKDRDDSDLEDMGEEDPMFTQAVAIVREYKVASISFLQRKLRVGYNRAARMIEIMEAKGWVSPSDGTSRPRTVNIPNDADA